MQLLQVRAVSEQVLTDGGMGGKVMGAKIAGLNDITGEGAVGVGAPQSVVQLKRPARQVA